MRRCRFSTCLMLCLLCLAVGEAASAAVINVALGKSATASETHSSGYIPDRAIDNNEQTVWLGGSVVPQWIEIDLGDLYSITGMRVYTFETHSSSTTTHEVSFDGNAEFSWSGVTTNYQWLEQVFATPRVAQTVRITTTVSPGWVGWREIQIFGEPAPEPVPSLSPLSLALLCGLLTAIGMRRRANTPRSSSERALCCGG